MVSICLTSEQGTKFPWSYFWEAEVFLQLGGLQILGKAKSGLKKYKIAHWGTPIYIGCNVTSQHPSSGTKPTASCWGKPTPQPRNCTAFGGTACRLNKKETWPLSCGFKWWIITRWKWLFVWEQGTLFAGGLWWPVALPRGGLCSWRWWKRGVFFCGVIVFMCIDTYISILMEQNHAP